MQSSSDKWLDVHNPATNDVVARVPVATQSEMHSAVDAAATVGRVFLCYF